LAGGGGRRIRAGDGGAARTAVKAPPPLESIHSGAMEIPQDGKPDLSRFQARDGTWLAYRLYPPSTARAIVSRSSITARRPPPTR